MAGQQAMHAAFMIPCAWICKLGDLQKGYVESLCVSCGDRAPGKSRELTGALLCILPQG